MAAAAIL